MWVILRDISGILLLFGSIILAFVGGLNGLPFVQMYVLSAIGFFVAVRFPMSGGSMVESTVADQKAIPAYFLPLIIMPAVFFTVGWVISGLFFKN